MSHRIRRLFARPSNSVKIWLNRMVFWSGAITVALAAVAFQLSSGYGNHLFRAGLAHTPALSLVVTPLGFAAILYLTRRFFPGSQGSGIPQTIAAMNLENPAERDSVLSLRVAAGKVLLTSLALACGASVGREGPTVQIGASVMHVLGRWIKLPIQNLDRMLILAGGAGGIAAAFNTPLAGVVFGIEELSRSFESKTSGTVLTTVIVCGITSVAIMGNYTYFGHTSAQLSLARAWEPTLACGVLGGVLGGGFSRVLLMLAVGLPGKVGLWIRTHPLTYAAGCGLGIALLGLASGNAIYGTGYEEAKALVEGTGHASMTFGFMKMAATILSYASGIPGGIFAPSLAVGSGIGTTLAPWMPGVPLGALAILGMVGYFTGVVQAPITAVVIVMEMTDNQTLTLPMMAAALIAFGLSRLICPHPLYKALAQGFTDKIVQARG